MIPATKHGRRTRALILFDDRPASDCCDPALETGSRSPILGVSFAFIERIRGGCAEGDLARFGRDYRLALAAGRLPPPRAVDLDDWWNIARWMLEGRRAARLESEGMDAELAREQAGLDVAAVLGSLRELLR